MRTVNSLCRYQRPRRRPPRPARTAAHRKQGNVTRSEPLAFRWRRTAFARIDGAVESVENDWSLFVDGLSAARIYRVRGGPNDGRWFWTVQIGPGRVPFNTGPVTCWRRPRGARGLRSDLASDGRRLSAQTAARSEALCADLAQVAGTSLNKGVEPRKPIYSGE